MKHIGTKAIRDVGGELLSKTVVEAGCARIETIRRKITGGMGWHFRQPQPVLFLYRRGAARRLRGSLDGRHIDHAFAGNLALFPADMEIDGEFKLGVSAVEYTVVFFETPFVETRAGNCLDRAQLVFQTPRDCTRAGRAVSGSAISRCRIQHVGGGMGDSNHGPSSPHERCTARLTCKSWQIVHYVS